MRHVGSGVARGTAKEGMVRIMDDREPQGDGWDEFDELYQEIGGESGGA